MTKEREIALFMQQELEKHIYLYQETIVYEIIKKFGEQYAYINANGNYSISRNVLKEFRKLNEDTVVWERGERMWRKRVKSDPEGKRMIGY